MEELEAQCSNVTPKAGLVSQEISESFDEVRKLIAEEGKGARNLLAWSVPVDINVGDSNAAKARKPPTSPRGLLMRSPTPEGARRTIRRFPEVVIGKSRLRSASVGRNPKFDLRARYWAFLFENLRRAVDEIYSTCEADESIIECRETIMVLENYTKDFRSFIEWLTLKRDFESTPTLNRPTSLTWEVKRPYSKTSLHPAANHIQSFGVKLQNIEREKNENVLRALRTDTAVQTENEMPVKEDIHTKFTDNPLLSTAKVEQQTESSNVQEMSSAIPAEITPKVTAATNKISSAPVMMHKTFSKATAMGRPSPSRPVVEVKKPTAPTVYKSKPVVSTSATCNRTIQLVTASTGRGKLQPQSAPVKKSVAASCHPPEIRKDDQVQEVAPEADMVHTDDDGGGWEMVQRVRSKGKSQAKSTPSAVPSQTVCSRSHSIAGFEMWKSKAQTPGSAASGSRVPISYNATVPTSKNDPKKCPTNQNGVADKKKQGLTRSMPSLYVKSQLEKCKDLTNNKRRKDSAPVAKSTKGNANSNEADTNHQKMKRNGRNGNTASKLSRELFKPSHSGELASGAVSNGKMKELDSFEEHKIMNDDESEISSARDFESELNQSMTELTSMDSSQEQLPVDSDSSEKTRLHCNLGLEGKPDSALSWGEQMDRMDAELRQPGRIIQMHDKLSSPSRKQPLSESIRRHEEKQAKAQEQRERLLEEKAQRLRKLSKKVEEKRAWKEELVQQRRIIMEQKLMRAEEKRKIHMQMIVRKAHDEEEKVHEIAFINTLEAQNKRHDVMSKIQGHEARLQDIQEERQRRQEEKAAKEAAVEERKKLLESERQARLEEMCERRRLREVKIEQHHQEKEKERQEMAREKARDREERLSALQAAHQANVEELQKKIQQKQEDSARRHEENIENIRQRAFEFSILRSSSSNDDVPAHVPYETKKLCALCNVFIGSEVFLSSHLRGKKHQQAIKEKNQGKDPSQEELEAYNLRNVINAPADKLDPQIALEKERQRSLRKRSKKIKQRMIARGNEFETFVSSRVSNVDSENKAKISKIIKTILKCFQSSISGPWPSNLVLSVERSLGELARLFQKKKINDRLAFKICGGFPALMQVLGVILNGNLKLDTVIPTKVLVNACDVYQAACEDCPENSHYVIYSNFITGLCDFLVHRLSLHSPKHGSQLYGSNTVSSFPVDGLSGSLLHLLATAISGLDKDQVTSPVTSGLTTKKSVDIDRDPQRLQDVISYIVGIGIVDKLADYFNHVRGPVDNHPQLAKWLQRGMAFITALSQPLSLSPDQPRSSKKCEDPTQLSTTLRVTELGGTVSLLYGTLLHMGAASRGGETPPQPLADATLALTAHALAMLNHVALMDLGMFQAVVGAEGTSLEFRHISSHLLWYMNHWPHEVLLRELLLSIGYFVVLNSENQTVIQSGHMPTVLQQMCTLPLQYFSEMQYADVLMPTLIVSCFGNQQNEEILEQEVSGDLLANYLEEKLHNLQQQQVHSKKEYSEDGDFRWSLKARLPEEKWNEARNFFRK